MNDGRDAEDARLRDSGEHARLLDTYEPVIIGRCVAGSADSRGLELKGTAMPPVESPSDELRKLLD